MLGAPQQVGGRAVDHGAEQAVAEPCRARLQHVRHKGAEAVGRRSSGAGTGSAALRCARQLCTNSACLRRTECLIPSAQVGIKGGQFLLPLSLYFAPHTHSHPPAPILISSPHPPLSLTQTRTGIGTSEPGHPTLSPPLTRGLPPPPFPLSSPGHPGPTVCLGRAGSLPPRSASLSSTTFCLIKWRIACAALAWPVHIVAFPEQTERAQHASADAGCSQQQGSGGG